MKTLSEHLNESVVTDVLTQPGMGGLLAILIGAGLELAVVTSNYYKKFIDYYVGGYSHPLRRAIADCAKDKKVEKICKRLSEDPDIIEFMEKPDKEQRGHWQKLVLSKLKDDEKQYLKTITRNKCK